MQYPENFRFFEEVEDMHQITELRNKHSPGHSQS